MSGLPPCPRTRSRRPSPSRRERPARARSPPRRRRAPRGTASRPGPSRPPRPPTRGRGTRTPTAPRRRCRRTRSGVPQAEASAISSSAISSAASGRAIASIASRIRASRSGSPSSSSTRPGARSSSRLGHDDGAAAALEVAGVQRLVVAGRVRVRDENGGRAGGRQLPDRPTGAGDREIRRRERGAELVRVGEHDVVLARHRGADPLVVALAGQVQDGRARSPRTRARRSR